MAGADSSIYSMIRPYQQGPGPLDQYAQGMQLKALMGQGELHDIKKRGLLRDEQTGQQLRDLFGRNPNPTDAEVMGVDPVNAGPAYLRNRREAAKSEAEAMKIDRENFIALADNARKRMAAIRDPQAWQMFRDEQIQMAGMFKTQGIREMALKAAQAMPPEFNPNYIRDSLVAGEKLFTPTMTERTDGQRKWMEDTNPFTNPAILQGRPTQMQMTPGESATDSRGWAQMNLSAQQSNQPKFDSERGVFIAPPPVGVVRPRSTSMPQGVPQAPQAIPSAPQSVMPAVAPQAQGAGSSVIQIQGIGPKPKTSKFEDTLAQESAKQYSKIIEDSQKVLEEGTLTEEALAAFLDYSKSTMAGTGPVTERFKRLPFTDQYLGEKTQALAAIFNKINLKAMVKTFSGMSRAIDTEVERAAWDATQPSVKLDDKVNAQILVGALSLSAKTNAEAAAQKAYMDQHQSLRGYVSPVIGKVDVLFGPDGKPQLVPKSEARARMQQGFKTGNDYAAGLLGGARSVPDSRPTLGGARSVPDSRPTNADIDAELRRRGVIK